MSFTVWPNELGNGKLVGFFFSFFLFCTKTKQAENECASPFLLSPIYTEQERVFFLATMKTEVTATWLKGHVFTTSVIKIKTIGKTNKICLVSYEFFSVAITRGEISNSQSG